MQRAAVSPSGFYAWQGRSLSQHAKDDERLKVLVGASRGASRKTDGSPRMHKDLVGEHIGRNRVIRLMQAGKLAARVKRRYHSTTLREHDQPVAPDILDRELETEVPN